MKFTSIYKRDRMLTLQLIGWGVILGTSLFQSIRFGNDKLDTFTLAMFGVNIFILSIIYLLNYFVFIPKFLFANKKWSFFIANLLLLLLLLLFSYYSNATGLFENLRTISIHRPRPSGLMFIARDLVNYVLLTGLVTALRLTERLQQSEEALKEAEAARVKAELANLRSQINPHFLLNTLNNIYALTAIDTDKAQKTIKELSDLLRYVLYGNLGDRVALNDEIDFLKSYIELMSIRLPRKMVVQTSFKISPHSPTRIAPLIFISLIENAFKHSVSASGEGFIELSFEDCIEKEEVRFFIKNSNNAKQIDDKSGHGIGLEQVKKRLELLYPNKYQWEIETSSDYYQSILTLKTDSK